MINVIPQLLPTQLPVMRGQSWLWMGRVFPLRMVVKIPSLYIYIYILLSDVIHVKTEINYGSMLWQLRFASIGLLSLKLKCPPTATTLAMEGRKHLKESSD